MSLHDLASLLDSFVSSPVKSAANLINNTASPEIYPLETLPDTVSPSARGWLEKALKAALCIAETTSGQEEDVSQEEDVGQEEEVSQAVSRPRLYLARLFQTYVVRFNQSVQETAVNLLRNLYHVHEAVANGLKCLS